MSWRSLYCGGARAEKPRGAQRASFRSLFQRPAHPTSRTSEAAGRWSQTRVRKDSSEQPCPARCPQRGCRARGTASLLTVARAEELVKSQDADVWIRRRALPLRVLTACAARIPRGSWRTETLQMRSRSLGVPTRSLRRSVSVENQAFRFQNKNNG